MTDQEKMRDFYDKHNQEIGESFEDFHASVESDYAGNLDAYARNLARHIRLARSMNKT